ncbi:MAG: hypothetical protein HYX26_09075 [Acidobacteriales bacterium]|nr:hypothetical protein [Terriglobales bacterium]
MKRTATLLVLLLGSMALPTMALEPMKDKDGDYRIFSVTQRRDISACLLNNNSGLPPGLAKRDRLPPGLERQLRRNGKLPPGLQKKVTGLPSACSMGLPRLPEGWERVVLSDRVLILDSARVISDIFRVVRDVRGRR